MPLLFITPRYRRTRRPSTVQRPRDGAGASHLACPLAFSVTGLLLNGLAVMVQSDGGALAGFALAAGAPALAAIVALHFAGDVDEAFS